jgi:hypothetical protein
MNRTRGLAQIKKSLAKAWQSHRLTSGGGAVSRESITFEAKLLPLFLFQAEERFAYVFNLAIPGDAFEREQVITGGELGGG